MAQLTQELIPNAFIKHAMRRRIGYHQTGKCLYILCSLTVNEQKLEQCDYFSHTEFENTVKIKCKYR